MLEILRKEKYDEYEKFNRTHPKGHFMQSLKWAKMKPDWKNITLISLDEKNCIKGSISLLIRYVPIIKKSIIYAPRGPVCDQNDLSTLKELYRGIKKIAKDYNSYIFKCDPDIKSDNREFIQNLKKAGFEIVSGSKNFEGIQPCYVFRLDIKDKTPEAVFANFHSKTRYNINLSQKRGVIPRIGTKDDINDFSRLMNETGLRDEFVIRPPEYFANMLDVLGENARLYMADYKGRPIAGALLIHYGKKVWYLYGASGNADRNVMPNYLLQWEMIKYACQKKCDIYDFRGVSGDLSEDNPLYGLYRFKKGFSGEFIEFLGEAQIVFSPFYNNVINKADKIFREVRRKLYLFKGRK